MMQRLILIFLAFFIVNSVSAQEYGLLLGLRFGSNYNTAAQLPGEEGPPVEAMDEFTQAPPVYRTILLRLDEGQLSLAAEKDSLLVPREDGFWRVDVKHSVYNDFTEDFIWVNPAPDPDMPPNPFLASKQGIEAFEVALLTKEQGIEARRGEYCVGHIFRDILFAGYDHLSVGYINNETCRGTASSLGGSALQLLSIDDLEPVELAPVLEEEGQKAFETAAKSYQEKHKDQGSQQWEQASAGILRHQGQWVVKGHFARSKNDYTNFEVPIALPEALTSPANLETPDWQTITTQMPDAVDAFVSPDKGILIVLTKTQLLGFTLDNDKIGQKPSFAYRLKHPVTVVMAKWEEGQFIENWQQELESLGGKPQKSWLMESKVSNRQTDQSFKLLGVVTTPEKDVALNIREGLGEHTKLVAKLDKDTKIQILDILGQWYKVQLQDGQVGYALSHYIKLLPKIPHVRAEACPVKPCHYGEWQLKEVTTLYATPALNANKLAELKASQVVQAQAGEMHLSQYGEVQAVKSTEVNVLPIDASSVEARETLKLDEGDILFTVENKGEGVYVMWYGGKLYYLDEAWNPEVTSKADLWGQVVGKPKDNWWVEVIVPAENISGWIVNPVF